MQKLIIVASLIGSLFHASQAGTITLYNNSKSHQPIQAQIQKVYETARGDIKKGNTQTIIIGAHQSVSFDFGPLPNRIRSAGIIPLSIDGHALPMQVTDFTSRNSCTAHLDRHHKQDALFFTVKINENGHDRIDCNHRQHGSST